MKLMMILVTTLMAFSASAQNLSNSERLDRLEQQVRDLKSRVRSLEGRDEDDGGRRRRNNTNDECSITFDGRFCSTYAVEINAPGAESRKMGECSGSNLSVALESVKGLVRAGVCNAKRAVGACKVTYDGRFCSTYAIEIDGKKFGECIGSDQSKALRIMGDLRDAGLCL